MIIVSQDKKIIVNFNQLQEIEINTPGTWNQKFYTIDTYPLGEGSKNHIRLAKYKTEERAKEVLEEIIESYLISMDYKYNQMLLVEDLEEYRENLVYKMPKS